MPPAGEISKKNVKEFTFLDPYEEAIKMRSLQKPQKNYLLLQSTTSVV